MKCETIEELERFREIQEQALGKSSPEVAATIRKIADMHFSKGDYERAERLTTGALEILFRCSGPRQLEIDEAERALMRIRLARKPLSDSIAISTVTGAQAFCSEEAPDAISELELEIVLLKQTIGKRHPAVADAMTKLADLYCRVKDYDKMEPLLVEALRIREASCGPDHFAVSVELKNLAQYYTVKGKYTLAEEYFKRALLIRERSLGVGHTKVLAIKEQYAKLLAKMNSAPSGSNVHINARPAR